MLQLRNESPFEVGMFGFPDRDGVDTFYVVVKGTFAFGPTCLVIADEQRPVTLADEYLGEPGESSLRYATEAHLAKPGTDVIVIGDACAPGGRPVEQLDLSVMVGTRRKDARAHGDRYWTEGIGRLRPSRPKPFVRVPVVYERAFGGRHIVDPSRDEYLAIHDNPVGCGFLGKRKVKEILGHPVPNIEDPRAPVTSPGSRGVVAGFGPIAPSWQPRARYVGTYDEAWEQTRAPYLPRDFDPRFFNIAPAPLVFPRGLVGGEAIAMLGFHPQGLLRCTLPRCELNIALTLAGRSQRLDPALETVVLEPTAERISLSWRSSLRVDKQMLQVEEVAVSLGRIDGVEQEKKSA